MSILIAILIYDDHPAEAFKEMILNFVANSIDADQTAPEGAESNLQEQSYQSLQFDTPSVSFGFRFDLPHDKINKMACAPSKDLDQPGHPPSLINLCCLHEETLGPHLPVECTAPTLIRLGGCPG